MVGARVRESQRGRSSLRVTYDTDGNLTRDAQRHYDWDGEDRLTAVYKLSPDTGDKKLEFDYDYVSRRIGRRKYTWFGGAGESKARRSEYWCAGDAHGAVGRPAA